MLHQHDQLCHAHTLAHVGEYVQAIHALTSSTFISPFDETTKIICFFNPLVEVDFPTFIDDFHFEMKFTLDQDPIIFALVHSSHFSSWWSIGYGVWAFIKKICLKWFCEWFRPLFQHMWAHCLRSCSTFSITFVFCISIPSIGKTIWRHTSHCNWWGDLSFSCLHCRNPNLAKCGGEAQHLEKLGIWSSSGLPNVQSSTAGPKTPRIGVFLVSLERSWSVDIENALVLGIWTSVAQVMGKRRAGSQIGSLTPDH